MLSITTGHTVADVMELLARNRDPVAALAPLEARDRELDARLASGAEDLARVEAEAARVRGLDEQRRGLEREVAELQKTLGRPVAVRVEPARPSVLTTNDEKLRPPASDDKPRPLDEKLRPESDPTQKRRRGRT